MRKYPSDAATVYTCSTTATKLTKKYYRINGRADNSDAFRHCLWAALIKQKIGKSKAKQWTTAHEGNGKDLETKMDMYNNGVGISISVNGKLRPVDIAEKVKAKVKGGKCKRIAKNKLVKTDGSGLLR